MQHDLCMIQTDEQACQQIREQAGQQIGQQVGQQTGQQIGQQVGEQTGQQIKEQIKSQIDQQITLHTEHENQVRDSRNNWFKMLGLPSLIYGVLFTYCMYRNYNGITMPLWVLLTVNYVYFVSRKAKVQWNRVCTLLSCAMFLFGVSTVLTGNWLIIIGNYMAFFFCLLLILLLLTSKELEWGTLSLCKHMLYAVCGAIARVADPVIEGISWAQSQRSKPSKKGMEILIGCLIAIPSVLVLGAILASADAVFKDLLSNLVFGVKIPFNVFTVAMMLLFGIFSSYCGMHYFLGNKKCIEARQNNKKSSVIAITFSIMILGLYLVFCGIQVIYLFAGLGTLPEGMTNATYARQGFFQLLFVAVLNLIYVFIIKYVFEERKALNLILVGICLCTYIMCASSCYRMLLYIEAYHLTVLRLLVLFALAVIAILFAGVVLWLINKKFPVYQFGLCVVLVSGLILSFSRIDYLIARYDIQYCEEDETTLNYVTSLSTDAAPVIADYLAQHQEVRKEVEQAIRYNTWSKKHHESLSFEAYQIVGFIDQNSDVLSGRSLRQWNWSYYEGRKALLDNY